MDAEITYYTLLTDVQNTKELAAAKKRPSLKKFSLKVIAFSCREQVFSGYSVSLFHKSSCGHPFLNG